MADNWQLTAGELKQNESKAREAEFSRAPQFFPNSFSCARGAFSHHPALYFNRSFLGGVGVPLTTDLHPVQRTGSLGAQVVLAYF